MTIPASHKDMVVTYLAMVGEQRFRTIGRGMAVAYPEVCVTSYLLKKLCVEGRIERLGLDSYRVCAPPLKRESP